METMEAVHERPPTVAILPSWKRYLAIIAAFAVAGPAIGGGILGALCLLFLIFHPGSLHLQDIKLVLLPTVFAAWGYVLGLPAAVLTGVIYGWFALGLKARGHIAACLAAILGNAPPVLLVH